MPLTQTTTVGPWDVVGAFDPNPPYYATGSTSYTSGTFNAAANSILVFTIALAGAGNTTVSSITNTGTALTWTRAVRRTATAAYAEVNEEIWYALNTSAQTGITYTVTWTENTNNYTDYARGYLRVFTGHRTSNPFPASYSGVGGANSKPWTTSALNVSSGSVVVGVFSDGVGNATANPLSSTTADTTNGVVNSAGDHHTGFYIRGLSDALSGGTHTPIVTTVETSFPAPTGAFAVLATSEITADAAATETATGAAAASATMAVASSPSVTASAEAVAGNVLTAVSTPSVTAAATADAAVITTHNAEAASIITVGTTDTLALTQGMVAASTITAGATAVGATNTAANGAAQAIGAARIVIEGETTPGFLYATVNKNILTN